MTELFSPSSMAELNFPIGLKVPGFVLNAMFAWLQAVTEHELYEIFMQFLTQMLYVQVERFTQIILMHLSNLVIIFRVKQIESFQKKMFEKSSLEHEIEKYSKNSA